MGQVFTTAGMVDREKLEVTDHVFEEDHCRTIAVEYRLNGQLVRRSVWVEMYGGEELAGKQADLGG